MLKGTFNLPFVLMLSKVKQAVEKLLPLPYGAKIPVKMLIYRT